MATHSSVLAWRIPGTGEPGGLPSMGSHRVRHDCSDLAAAAEAAAACFKNELQNVIFRATFTLLYFFICEIITKVNTGLVLAQEWRAMCTLKN